MPTLDQEEQEEPGEVDPYLMAPYEECSICLNADMERPLSHSLPPLVLRVSMHLLGNTCIIPTGSFATPALLSRPARQEQNPVPSV